MRYVYMVGCELAGLTALANGDETRPTCRGGAQLNVDVMNNERDSL
jgi:hypothetical protein